MKKSFFSALCALCVSAADAPLAKDLEVEVRHDVPGTLMYPLAGHTPFGIHRGTPYWLEILTGGKTQFADARDLAVTRLVSTDRSKDEWDDVLVSVYGLNSGRGEIIYNAGNTHLKVFGREGSGPGEFRHALGIAASPEGRILVADTGNDRVVELHDDGKELRFKKVLVPSGGEGGLSGPSYLALDAAGGFFVSDTGKHRLLHFDREGGKPTPLWFGPETPWALAYADPAQDWFFPGEARLYLVLEKAGAWKILRLEPEKGGVLASAELPADGGPFGAMELDYQGNPWLVDTGGCRILKFGPDLSLLDSLGSRGSGDYRFQDPVGLAIWRRFGQVFVSEKQGAHYFWVGADAKNAAMNISKDGKQAVLSFRLTERALVRADWVSGTGKKAMVLPALAQTELLEGDQNLVLPLPYSAPASGSPVFQLRLRLMATYSTRERIEKEVSVPLPRP